MARESSGFAPIPAFLAKKLFESGALVPVMKEWIVETNPVQILIPKQNSTPLKIRAFVEFLASRLAPVV